MNDGHCGKGKQVFSGGETFLNGFLGPQQLWCCLMETWSLPLPPLLVLESH